jgi:hypothetical protein
LRGASCCGSESVGLISAVGVDFGDVVGVGLRE